MASPDSGTLRPSVNTSTRYEPVKNRHDELQVNLSAALEEQPVGAAAADLLDRRRESIASLRNDESDAFILRAKNAALPPNEPWSRDRLRHVCGLLVQQRTWNREPLLNVQAQEAAWHEIEGATSTPQQQAAGEPQDGQAPPPAETKKWPWSTTGPNRDEVSEQPLTRDEAAAADSNSTSAGQQQHVAGDKPSPSTQRDAAASTSGDEPAVVAPPAWRDVVRFVAAVNSLLKDERFPSKLRDAFESELLPSLYDSAFVRQDLRDFADALQLKLGIENERHHVKNTVSLASKAVDTLLPDVRNCERLLQRAIDDGEMAMAEQVASGQLRLYEHLLTLIESQYDALDHHKRTEAEEARKHRWAVFRAARHDVTAVVRRTKRRSEALEDDVARVRFLLEEARAEDEEKGTAYDETMASLQQEVADIDGSIDGKLSEMAELVAKIQAAEVEVAALSKQRTAIVTQRTVALEEEAKRVSSHDSLLHEANCYLTDAQRHFAQLRNALHAAECLQDHMLEGCNTVAERQKAASDRARELTLSINQDHTRLLSEYALCMTRHCHRKLNQWRVRSNARLSAEMQLDLAAETYDPQAKRFAMDRDTNKTAATAVMDELEDLRTQYSGHAKVYSERCVPHLDAHGVRFVHPSDIAGSALLDRREQVLNWRDGLDCTPRKLEAALDRERDAIAEALRKLRMAEATRELRAEGRRREHKREGRASAWARAEAANRRPRSAASWRSPEERDLEDSLKRFGDMVSRLDKQQQRRDEVPGRASSTSASSVAPPSAGKNEELDRSDTPSHQRPPVFTPTKPPQPQPAETGRSVAKGSSNSSSSSAARPPRPGTAPPSRPGKQPLEGRARLAPRLAADEVVLTPDDAAAADDPSARVVVDDDGEHPQAAAAAAPADDRGRCESVTTSAAADADRVAAEIPDRTKNPSTTLAFALYPYAAAASDELTFDVGDVIVVLGSTDDPGWYRGSCAHRVGVFPSNYVKFRARGGEGPPAGDSEPSAAVAEATHMRTFESDLMAPTSHVNRILHGDFDATSPPSKNQSSPVVHP